MTYKEIAEMLESTGLPYVYHSFTEEAPNLPYLVFTYPDNNDMSADNINYTHVVQLNLELYTESKDFETESIVEKMFTDNGLYYTKSTAYIESERMFQTLYITEILITKE